VISAYFTRGQYDFLIISDMPDAKAAGMLTLIASGGGSITDAFTIQAFSSADGKDMFERVGKIAGGDKPMGG
jgi:uncharacterized protein with GYD domain